MGFFYALVKNAFMHSSQLVGGGYTITYGIFLCFGKNSFTDWYNAFLTIICIVVEENEHFKLIFANES